MTPDNIDLDLYHRLQSHARRTGQPLRVLLERAIAQYLERAEAAMLEIVEGLDVDTLREAAAQSGEPWDVVVARVILERLEESLK